MDLHDFFEALRQRLRGHGIDLWLVPHKVDRMIGFEDGEKCWQFVAQKGNLYYAENVKITAVFGDDALERLFSLMSVAFDRAEKAGRG